VTYKDADGKKQKWYMADDPEYAWAKDYDLDDLDWDENGNPVNPDE
jgi:hypothetical protein